MLELTHLLFLLFLAALCYGLVAGIRVKELAQRAVEQRCRGVNVQLLDGTIALRGLGVARDGRGRLSIVRRFHFEFTATGADRNTGWITLRGSRVHGIEMAPHRFVD